MSAKDDGNTQNLVLMGRIGAAHGIRGEVRLQSFCDNPLDIASYGELTTGRAGESFRIEKARLAKNVIIASLAGVRDRNAAEKLNGRDLFVPRDRLPPHEDEDDFYHADLIGLEVRNGDGVVQGTVVAVPDFGAGSLIEFRELSGDDTQLVPFTKDNVPEINIEGGYLVIVPLGEITGEVME